MVTHDRRAATLATWHVHDDTMPTSSATDEYPIETLAQLTGVSVRNIRAYQARGLLPAPQRRGRQGIYSDIHLARLRIIKRLLERGYALAHIGELIHSWERGDGIAQVLGLEADATSSWHTEEPDYMSMEALAQAIGASLSGDALQRVIELDLIRPEGTRFRIPSPRLLHAVTELLQAGITLQAILTVIATLRDNVEQSADAMVRLTAAHLSEQDTAGRPPQSADANLLIWRLRPVTENILLPELGRALAQACRQHFGNRPLTPMRQTNEQALPMSFKSRS